MNVFPSRLALPCEYGEQAATMVPVLKAQTFTRDLQKGRPWQLLQLDKTAQAQPAAWKAATGSNTEQAASRHRLPGRGRTPDREEHRDRSRVGRKQLQLQNASQGAGMGSTGMELFKLR